MWFTNFNLPNGWDRRGARNHLNPDNCVLDGCYIMPNPYNGKNYIETHSTIMGRRGEMRDLFSFELERLKGLPMGYTRQEKLNADRNERIRTSWDMTVASRFLHHLSRDVSATTEQCSNTNDGQKRKSVELHRDKGHHDVRNIKRLCTAVTRNALARDLGKLAEQRKAPNSHVKSEILPSADMNSNKLMDDISTLWAVKNIVRCIYRPEWEDGSTH